ncbi:DUF1828 domain-containing protein [Aerococcaceae bacterium zg-BR33]|nr:DUF1828 domain-containing protein [Aerococcaceae bacterium zg-A91]MBS4458372.1 DUF1828 domain-containing protein [Aerococcaceae bacterium zg-BR33]
MKRVKASKDETLPSLISHKTQNLKNKQINYIEVFKLDIQTISNEYFDFIHRNAKLIKVSQSETESIAPYVDSTGEVISFSVKCDGKFYPITDDGLTIWDLETKSIDLNKSKRRDLFQSQLSFNGFSLSDKVDNILVPGKLRYIIEYPTD